MRVTTGKNLLSGTDAGVFITLHGRDGSSEETELKIDGEDCFERGETNSFKLKVKKNIGPITKIRSVYCPVSTSLTLTKIDSF